MLMYNTVSREITHLASTLSVGDIKFSFSDVNPHNNWVLCDGASYPTSTYPKLFALIGYTYGGAGANFNVPDARSRVLGAVGQGPGLSARTKGQLVGTETHTLTVAEIPSHNHGITDPGHSHTYLGVTGQNVLGGATDTAADENDRPLATTSSSGTGITVNNTGGGGAHNNMQPTLFIGNVFIYAGL
jgi:microcystin-dependent protein